MGQTDDTMAWGAEPDPLLDLVRVRARSLLQSEKLALLAEAHRGRADTAAALLANRADEIEDLRRAAAAAHRRIAALERQLDDAAGADERFAASLSLAMERVRDGDLALAGERASAAELRRVADQLRAALKTEEQARTAAVTAALAAHQARADAEALAVQAQEAAVAATQARDRAVAEINALRASTSWKVTVPVRAARHLLRR